MIRKNYFIKKGLQTRFIGTVFLIIALVFVVIFCNLYFFGLYLLDQDESQGPEGGKYAAALEKLKDDIGSKLAGRLALLGAVNLIIVALISLFFSHQIAGPVYKLERTLEKVISGDINVKFNFRKSDRMDELADLLNDMKDKFSETIKGSQDICAKAGEIIDGAAARKDLKTYETSIAQLKELQGQLASSLGEYRFGEAKKPAAAEAPAAGAGQDSEKKAGA